ncbi:MAG: hypothetical protein ACRDQD_18640, partial [Nocardioidaceae bacterium]
MSFTLNATLAVADTSPRGGQAPVPLPRLRAVLAHISRSLLVACFIPALLFFVCLATINLWAALIAALAWCYSVSA